MPAIVVPSNTAGLRSQAEKSIGDGLGLFMKLICAVHCT